MSYSRVAEMASTSAKNTTTSMLNALVGTNAARQPVANPDDEEEQLYQALIDAGLAPIKVAGGLLGTAGGLVFALIPKKKVELDSTEVFYTTESDEHYALVALENVSIADAQPSGILKVTDSSVELNKVTGDQETSTSTRSSLPLTIRASGEMAEPGDSDEARSIERKTTTLGGAQVAAASASVAIQGVADLLSGVFTLTTLAGRRAYGLYQQSTGPAQNEPNAANAAASTRPSTS